MLEGESKRSIKKITWTEYNIDKFNKLKELLSSRLHRFLPDLNNDFILTTDASDHAIGGILSQKNIHGTEFVINFFSKKMDKAQLNYSVTDKELLAAVKSIEHFRHYLLGRKFTLRTDHMAIKYLWETQNLQSRLMRWSLLLQEFDFEIEYLKGESNVADYLSRCFLVRSEERTYTDEEIKNILTDYHLNSGHGSINTMKFLLSHKSKWKNLYNDIEEYVKKCHICSKEGNKIPQTFNNIIRTTRPNQMWQIDLIGRILDKDGKNYFIFVAIDTIQSGWKPA